MSLVLLTKTKALNNSRECQEEEENKPSEFRYHEVSDDSDGVASTSLQLPQLCQSYFQDARQCSPFINHPSLIMELIYKLRGNMAKLHHEMSELRKSVGMQVKLHKSIKQEVSTAVSHSIRVEEMEIFNRVPMRKGNYCICYEICAHELHRSSGRCPICQDTIVDVVWAYSDS